MDATIFLSSKAGVLILRSIDQLYLDAKKGVYTFVFVHFSGEGVHGFHHILNRVHNIEKVKNHCFKG